LFGEQDVVYVCYGQHVVGVNLIEPIDPLSQALSSFTTRFSTTKPTSTPRTIATRDQSRLPVSSSINHRVNELRLRMRSVGINSIGFIILAVLKAVSGEFIGTTSDAF
jgi:hypothetical protein